MHINPADLSKAQSYYLMISAIVPRPIAWVGSRSAAGIDNLAPFSYFMGVSSEPPLLAISVAKGRKGSLKDTARNILETKEFSVSIVEEGQLEAMHQCSAPYEESEFEAIGILKAAGVSIQASRPAAARVACECRLEQALDLGSTHLLIGYIQLWLIEDGLLKEGIVDIEHFRPMARLGGNGYTSLGARLELLPARV
jgi:flavin reductase (DIM6/NTAB) family NADH-FMN oxidoreductase RutF